MTSCKTRTLTITIIAVSCLLATKTAVFANGASKNAEKIKHSHRTDLRNLGYPLINEIPANSSAITSLITTRDGRIYGGTSGIYEGEDAYFFIFDLVINKVRHLGKIKDQAGIHHAIAEDKDGYIYIGTGKSIFEDFEMHKWGPGHPSNPTEDLINWEKVEVDSQFSSYSDGVRYQWKLSGGDMGYQYIDLILWNDIKNHFKDYPGGHLYRYNPRESNHKVKLPDMECELEDLGIPVAGNSIYALTINPEGDVIYGVTYPDGHFFLYDIESKKLKDISPIDKEVTFHGPERHWRSLPRALICDDSGRVYTSGNDGVLVYYCPKSNKIVSTELEIPGDYYPAHPYTDYAVVEYFAKDDSGLIYGGSSDGYLFSFDPEEMQLVNLGKPRQSRRLRCLTVGKDGKVYLMAGERLTSRPCKFYCYDPQTGGFEDLMILTVDRSPYYSWRGFQFDSMTIGIDGTIYLGESDRRSHLFIYMP